MNQISELALVRDLNSKYQETREEVHRSRCFFWSNGAKLTVPSLTLIFMG